MVGVTSMACIPPDAPLPVAQLQVPLISALRPVSKSVLAIEFFSYFWKISM